MKGRSLPNPAEAAKYSKGARGRFACVGMVSVGGKRTEVWFG